MAFTHAWRNFKRMQDLVAGGAGLIYLGAALYAVDIVPGGQADLMRWIVVWPAGCLASGLILPLLIAPVRRLLARYVWMSFRAGFGQTPPSVVVGAAMLGAAGWFIYGEVRAIADGQTARANVFSAFAAGLGVLTAQASLTRALERLPQVRRIIEEP